MKIKVLDYMLLTEGERTNKLNEQVAIMNDKECDHETRFNAIMDAFDLVEASCRIHKLDLYRMRLLRYLRRFKKLLKIED